MRKELFGSPFKRDRVHLAGEDLTKGRECLVPGAGSQVITLCLTSGSSNIKQEVGPIPPQLCTSSSKSLPPNAPITFQSRAMHTIKDECRLCGPSLPHLKLNKQDQESEDSLSYVVSSRTDYYRQQCLFSKRKTKHECINIELFRKIQERQNKNNFMDH